jgi:hypothetical protein
VSLRMLTNLRLAFLPLSTAQQRTTGQTLPSYLYSVCLSHQSWARLLASQHCATENHRPNPAVLPVQCVRGSPILGSPSCVSALRNREPPAKPCRPTCTVCAGVPVRGSYIGSQGVHQWLPSFFLCATVVAAPSSPPRL